MKVFMQLMILVACFSFSWCKCIYTANRTDVSNPRGVAALRPPPTRITATVTRETDCAAKCNGLGKPASDLWCIYDYNPTSGVTPNCYVQYPIPGSLANKTTTPSIYNYGICY